MDRKTKTFLTDRNTNRQKHEQKDRKTKIQTERQIDKNMERKTNRQKHEQKHRQTNV